MKKIITILNEKGGCGKSTTASAITTGLKLAKQRVLLIDLDASGNVTSSFRADKGRPNVMDLMQGKATAGECIQATEQGDIIPATRELSLAIMKLMYPNDKPLEAEARKQIPYILKRSIQPVTDRYDYIVIDTPPTLSLITTIALTTSSDVIIPAEPEQYSLDGLGEVAKTIRSVKETTNKNLKIDGIVLTRFKGRTNLARQLAEVFQEVAKTMDTKVFSTVIRECSALAEAHTMKKSIYTYAPKSNGTSDYIALLKEIIKA